MNRLDSPSSKGLIPTATIGGVNVGIISRAQWAEVISERCREKRTTQRRPAFFTSANSNVLSYHERCPDFQAALRMADGIDADGMPMVFASRWFTKTPIAERCCTTDFFHDMARSAVKRNLSMFFLGGSERVNESAVRQIQNCYPDLQISGRRHGFWSPADEDSVVDQINSTSPDIVWVGLGVPTEHFFIARNIDRLYNVGALKTCGGLLDYICGDKPRAPMWMQMIALEWLYRLSIEPKRLFFRYATTNLHAAWLLASRTPRTRRLSPSLSQGNG